MLKTIKTRLAVAIGMLAVTASVQAAPFGAGLKTPGYEDVAILDEATFQIVAGADDGVPANFIAAAYVNAQVTGPNKRTPLLTERVLSAHLPEPKPVGQAVAPAEALQLQSLLLKRKEDVVNAKRFLLSVPLMPAFDEEVQGGGRNRTVLRDELGRYVVMLNTPSTIGGAWWVKDSARQVSFMVCQSSARGTETAFQSRHGRLEHCLGIPEFKDLNLPAGMLVSDLSKLGELGYMNRSAEGTSTVRAGIVIAPAGRSGTSGDRQGRQFTASELVIWDVATMEVLAGPYSLKTKNPDVVYATNNCEMTAAGLSLVLKVPGNCEKLNPTLPKRVFEMQTE